MHTFSILTAFLGGLVLAACGAEQNTCTTTEVVSITTNVLSLAATSAVTPKTADSVLPTGLTNLPNDSEGMQFTGAPVIAPTPSNILASLSPEELHSVGSDIESSTFHYISTFGSGAPSMSLPTTLPVPGPGLNITSPMTAHNGNNTSVSTSIKSTKTKTSGTTTTTGSGAASTTSAPASNAVVTSAKSKEAVLALAVVAGVMFFL